MIEIPMLSVGASTELLQICEELKLMLARYRKCQFDGPGSVYVVDDVLRLHEYVWDAVALLNDELSTLPPQATILAHVYQTRRDAFNGALSVCGLAEMIEFLEQLLAKHGWESAAQERVAIVDKELGTDG